MAFAERKDHQHILLFPKLRRSLKWYTIDMVNLKFSSSIITAKNCPFSRNHKNDDWSRKHGLRLRLRLRDYLGLCCIRRKPANPNHPAWHIFVEKAVAAKCAFFSFIKKGFLRSVLKCNFFCRDKLDDTERTSSGCFASPGHKNNLTDNSLQKSSSPHHRAILMKSYYTERSRYEICKIFPKPINTLKVLGSCIFRNGFT